LKKNWLLNEFVSLYMNKKTIFSKWKKLIRGKCSKDERKENTINQFDDAFDIERGGLKSKQQLQTLIC
jgi:hypothetical protein